MLAPSGSARAEDASGPRFELALRTGYGAPISPGGTANPFAFGTGGRAGFAGYSFYGGVFADRWFGSTWYSGEFRNSWSTWVWGAEVALDAVGEVIPGNRRHAAWFAVIRPSLSVGDISVAGNGPSSPFVGLGLTLLASVGSIFFGVDSAVMLPTAELQGGCSSFGCEPVPDLWGALIRAQAGVTLWP
jgi:hypothetical protein